MALVRTLQQGNYEAVILFQSILSNAILPWLQRIPIRIGFAQDGCQPFLTHPVAPRREGEHVVEAYRRLAMALGEPAHPNEVYPLNISVTPADFAFAENFLVRHEVAPPVVGLVVGATRPQKRWREEYFARLADKLWTSAGVCSVLLGGPEESEAARRIQGRVNAPLVSAVGTTTEKQLAALVARLEVVISGDSGPLHIAMAMGTPVVALFGSTDPTETGPWNALSPANCPAVVLYDALPCSPCRKNPTCQGRFDCLQGISPERVFEETCKLLQIEMQRTTLPMAITTTGGER
jgi:heptosyltransferase-1